MPRTTKGSSRRLDISKLKRYDTRQTLFDGLALGIYCGSVSPSNEEEWNYLQEYVFGIASAVLGTSRQANNDWFEKNLHVIQSVLKLKRQAFIKNKRESSETHKHHFIAQKNTVKSTAGDCASNHWHYLGETIQGDADRGNLIGMYLGIRKACGRAEHKTAPMKATLS